MLISDMNRRIIQLTNDKYQSIVLVGLGNDCADTKDATVVANILKDLISAVKINAASVTVASICPKGDPEIHYFLDNANIVV